MAKIKTIDHTSEFIFYCSESTSSSNINYYIQFTNIKQNTFTFHGCHIHMYSIIGGGRCIWDVIVRLLKFYITEQIEFYAIQIALWVTIYEKYNNI